MSDLKKVWTFSEMYEKVREDIDLNEDDPDEQFITLREIIGYFNEGIQEASKEILTLNQDYFLTSDYLPQVTGQSEYALPDNIMAQKFRGLIFNDGSRVYSLKRFRNNFKFEDIALSEIYSGSEDYRYYISNDSPGNQKIVLIPPSREDAVVPPLSPVSAPIKRWYIRNPNRVPYVGEYTNPENILPSAVDTGTSAITVNPLVTYVTGDAVKFSVINSNTLPSPLVAGTVYYVIAVSSTSIKLATSRALALAGTNITLTTTGTNYFTMKVAATTAIIDATLIDIPEGSTFIMEWVKAKCFFKDGDPRALATAQLAEQQRKILIDSLVESEPDNDDQVQADYSYYDNLS